MTDSVRLLDCTLRDGGYLVDTQFGDDFIRGFIRNLTDAGLDVIEVGFLKDIPHEPGSTIFNNAAQIAPYLPAQRNPEVSYVTLADYGRYDVSQLEPCDGTSIDGVRACFFRKDRKAVLEFCRQIQARGYLLYVQPVDILGYSDEELLDLIRDVNELQPFALSTVDTFGSMYPEDLQRVFSLIHHNLDPRITMGFHSHNNLQMSFALSQEFVRLAQGRRGIVVDATMCGMGRGAGNTNTELVASFLNTHRGGHYDLDLLLDVADNYMDGLRSRCEWGYSIPYFLAGVQSAHVHNITYLSDRPSIRARDMMHILQKLDPEVRKRYDYDLLEKLYLEELSQQIDDSAALETLQKAVGGRKVLLILPGHSVEEHRDEIRAFIQREKPVVIHVNMCNPDFARDFAFFSNAKRYDFWHTAAGFGDSPCILTSNIADPPAGSLCVNLHKLLKGGFRHTDNSTIVLLRLLDRLGPESVTIAGFDGYDAAKGPNFVSRQLERHSYGAAKAAEINAGIREVLKNFFDTYSGSFPVLFLTPSRFEEVCPA